MEKAFAKHFPHLGDALLVFGNVDKMPAIQKLIGPKGGVPNLYSYREGRLMETIRGFPSQALRKTGDRTYVSGNILLNALNDFLAGTDKPAPSKKLSGPGF